MIITIGEPNRRTEKEVHMKRIFVGLLSGVMVLAFASQYAAAQACGPTGGPGRGFPGQGMPMMSPMGSDGMGMMGRERRLWRLFAALGLDEQQRADIRKIKSRVMKDTIREKADLEVVRIDVRDILAKDQVDMNAVEAALKKIASLQTDIRLSHIKAMQEIKAKLTPEQRKKFRELLEMCPRAERMTRGGMRMAPPAGDNGGALPEKEQ